MILIGAVVLLVFQQHIELTQAGKRRNARELFDCSLKIVQFHVQVIHVISFRVLTMHILAIAVRIFHRLIRIPYALVQIMPHPFSMDLAVNNSKKNEIIFARCVRWI